MILKVEDALKSLRRTPARPVQAGIPTARKAMPLAEASRDLIGL